MSFFNLTMVGHPEPYRHYQTPEVDRSLPPINCPKMYTRHFSKPFDSNLKYHELRTKHIRHPQGNRSYINSFDKELRKLMFLLDN